MKLRLSILLLAAALAAAPAAGQTVKSLGYNTTNGFVTYSGTNSLTFTNALQFATNARAATRTNLELGATWLTNTNVTNFRTAVGLGTTNDVTFSNITASGILYAKDSTASPATNSSLARGIQWTNLAGFHAAIYGSYPGAPQIALAVGASNSFSDVATFRATGMTVNSNAVVGGTLAVTGNVTLSGVNNTATAQTADSASSLMTRDLSDDRYTTSIWLTQISDNQTITNGGFQLLTPGRINTFSIGYGASVPSGFTEFRVVLGFGWLQNPATNSTNFPVFVQFENKGASSGTTVEAEHGTAFSRGNLYPTNAASTGLAGTLTRRAVFNTTNTVYSFISDWVTIPNTWQSNASSNGFYHIIGAAIANNTGGSLTDGYNVNHPAVGLIEFRK